MHLLRSTVLDVFLYLLHFSEISIPAADFLWSRRGGKYARNPCSVELVDKIVPAAKDNTRLISKVI